MLRAFVSADKPGSGGECGVVFDLAKKLSEIDRQQITATHKLPEIVYIDCLDEEASVQVFTPSRQRPYAGYPLIATAWLLHQQGYSVHTIHPPAGSLSTHADTSGAFLSLPLAWVHPYEFQEVKDLAVLREQATHDAPLHTTVSDHERVVLWAWSDPVKRRVVTRSTLPDHPRGQGISASIALSLGARVGTPLLVEQGNASVCTVVSSGGVLEVGGRVVLDEVRRLDDRHRLS